MASANEAAASASGAASAPQPAPSRYEHIIIAVHGIGEQLRNSTVRSVATRLAEARVLAGDMPAFAPQPLGYFHTDVQPAVEVYPLDHAVDELPAGLKQVGFAEVFWADIPQEVVAEGRTLEEVKAWARTVVARARALHRRAALARGASDVRVAEPDFGRAGEVLEEMVDTIYVLERVLSVAKFAGIFEFDLRKVLEDYLGDVQIVTEFEAFRTQIVGRFSQAMASIHAKHPRAKLHVVAHSEGTVVSFLGLLRAMSREHFQPRTDAQRAAWKAETHVPGWLRQVRGFMTFGSPIDKHLLLWPSLFESLDIMRARGEIGDHAIRWRNYYDVADPVGFELDTTRRWLDLKGDRVFEFCGCPVCRHDVGFSRYVLPGKAHTDYWGDAEVFEHFAAAVIAATPPSGGGPKADPEPRPGNRFGVKLASMVLPYLLSAAVMFLATFILYKAVDAYVRPEPDAAQKEVLYAYGYNSPARISNARLALNALCVAALFAGTTLATRYPRLLDGTRRWVLAAVALCVGCLVYAFGVDPDAQAAIGAVFGPWTPSQDLAPSDRALLDRPWLQIAGTVAVSILTAVLCLVLTIRPRDLDSGRLRKRPNRWIRRGMRPLLIAGAAAIAVVVFSQPVPAPPDGLPDGVKEIVTPHAAAWPLVLAGAAFLYLWWLATLVFGLASVWHRYVRKSVALERLEGWASLVKGVAPRDRNAPERHRELPLAAEHTEPHVA